MSNFKKFWEILEAKLGSNVPIYVQNILAFNGYENALSVGTLTSEDIVYLQNYARNEMHKRIPKDADLKEYYGYFSENPTEFEFLRGHVKFLEKIVSFINVTIASKGPDVFSCKTNKIQQNNFSIGKNLLGKNLI